VALARLAIGRLRARKERLPQRYGRRAFSSDAFTRRGHERRDVVAMDARDFGQNDEPRLARLRECVRDPIDARFALRLG